MHAMNTSFDGTRLDTPFYLLHGFDCRSTIAAMLGPKPTDVTERTAYEWRRKLQRDYSYAHACTEELQKKAKRTRSAVQTQKWKILSEHLKSGFEVGDSVWLYIPKVLPGLSRKLIHLWHGPFRIEQVRDGFTIDVSEEDDFDAALLPEHSWEPDSVYQEYEIEEIVDLRWTKRTRNAKRIREYLIKWKGYDELQWLPVSQFNCGSLLYKFNQSARAKSRFAAM
ncbi:hypothetical protein PHMEG_00024903 [Phytophthora megakarya]|uniref:Chromo domain-containing protein n=1 Tax=Phytophthora megakarya TaxID=4795 RepID=A0A225VEK7_9STRA|nr:hypothetical protein PHMEG_00024903 [Phytophthora megakarya]